MFLAYDPSEYEQDLRYLLGYHKEDLISYKQRRFPANNNEIVPMMQDITKGYISNLSNIYSNKVIYSGITDNPKYKKMLKRKKTAMKELEKFYNMQDYSVLWTYKENNEIKFLALDASNFYIQHDNYGNIAYVIVRAGNFIDASGQKQFIFYKWENGTVTKAISESWINFNSDDPEIEWIADILPTYTVLPFTIMKNRFASKPIHSTLIDLENEAVAGDAFAIMAMLYSLIVKYVLISDGSGPAIQKMINDFGVATKIMQLGAQGDDAKAMSQVTTDNHMNYKDYVQRILMFRGQIDGVDKQALFPETKVESGASRRLQMGSIEAKRNDRIVEWEEFEDRHWELINQLDPTIPIPEDYIFEDLPSSIDPTEQPDIDRKEYDLLRDKYIDGVLTLERYIRESNENIDEKEIRMLMAGIEKEIKERTEQNENIDDEEIENEDE